MKNTNKKQTSIDPIAEARKGKYFEKYSKEAHDRIKLAVEIYKAREAMKMSQQKLAKLAETTQKVISKIENGDVNIGYSLLNRIANVLNFDHQNWSNIFNFNAAPIKNLEKEIKEDCVFKIKAEWLSDSYNDNPITYNDNPINNTSTIKDFAKINYK